MSKLQKIIVILWAVITVSAIQAADWDFGVKLGLNQTTLTNTYESEGVNALTAGLFAEKKLANFYGLYIEMTYNHRKTNSVEDYRSVVIIQTYQDDYDNRRPGEDGYYSASTATKTDYVDLDLLFKLFPPGTKRMIPYIYGGPVVSLLIDGSKTVVHSRVGGEYGISSGKFVLSYAVGAGMDINIKGMKTSLDIRMTRALTKLLYRKENVSEQSSIQPYEYIPEYKNNFISATLGVSLFRR